MVKTVVKTKELAHLWANQVQPYAKTCNRYFENNRYYSYSTEIACFISNSKEEQAIILDNSNYSVTTSKHQNELNFACKQFPIFEYVAFNNSRYNKYTNITPSQVTPDYLYQHYIEQATELAAKSKRAKKAECKLKYIKQAKHYLQKANLVIDWFDTTNLEILNENQFDELLETLSVEAETARKQAEEIRKAKIALNLEFYKETFEKWLAGDLVNFPSCYHDKGIFLRVKEDLVETSRGATFPVDSCETIFKVYKRAVNKNEVYSDPIKVGHYTISHISKKGIIAGCHHIKPSEIERFAGVLKLNVD